MTKKSKTNENEKEVQSQSEERGRAPRRKVYERVRDAVIPKYVYEHFAKENYYPKLVRWSIRGEPDYRYLARREHEGYEFVTADELPEQYLKALRVKDTQVTNGLVTNGGDLCLMKIDIDLRNSRIDYFHQEAQGEVDAVNINVLEKKGLRNTGSRSKVMMREPSFQE